MRLATTWKTAEGEWGGGGGGGGEFVKSTTKPNELAPLMIIDIFPS